MKLSDYDQRQLIRIINLICSYEGQSLGFCNLVSEISALIDTLENMQNIDKEDLRSLWINLEVSRALVLCEEEEDTMLKKFLKLEPYINEDVSKIKAFVEKLLGDMPVQCEDVE